MRARPVLRRMVAARSLLSLFRPLVGASVESEAECGPPGWGEVPIETAGDPFGSTGVR